MSRLRLLAMPLAVAVLWICATPCTRAQPLQGGVVQNDFAPPPPPPGFVWQRGDQDMGPCNAHNRADTQAAQAREGGGGGICRILDANRQQLQAAAPAAYIPFVEHLAYPASAQLRTYDALGNLNGEKCLELDAHRWTFPAPTPSH